MTHDKQSSIEWLQAIELERDLTLADWNKAKAMHKEEMKQTYFDGWHRNIGNRDEDFEQYYNETFGNEQQ